MSDKIIKEYTLNNTNEFYDLDNINEFYEGIEASPNPKLTKLRVWCNYYNDEKASDEKVTEPWFPATKDGGVTMNILRYYYVSKTSLKQ